MKIIGTGLSGLVGSRVRDLLSDTFSFTDLSKETGVDITSYTQLTNAIATSDAPWVFHFAAYTDVQKAEESKDLYEKSDAWRINVDATEQLVSLCQKHKKHLIYISTDYVFDGKKAVYTEDDLPHPLNFYAMTKWEGEKRVASLGSNSLIIRIANPYRANPVGKRDFVHKIVDVLQNGSQVKAPDDQEMVPTFIDDIANAIRRLIHIEANGIYHVVGADSHTPFHASCLIAREFGLPEASIARSSFESYYQSRAPIPKHAVLSINKIVSTGIVMKTFEEGLRVLHKAEN